jgi:hypothetical protein
MQGRGSLAKQVDGPAHCSPSADQLRGRVTLDGSQRTRFIVGFPCCIAFVLFNFALCVAAMLNERGEDEALKGDKLGFRS